MTSILLLVLVVVVVVDVAFNQEIFNEDQISLHLLEMLDVDVVAKSTSEREKNRISEGEIQLTDRSRRR